MWWTTCVWRRLKPTQRACLAFHSDLIAFKSRHPTSAAFIHLSDSRAFLSSSFLSPLFTFCSHRTAAARVEQWFTATALRWWSSLRFLFFSLRSQSHTALWWSSCVLTYILFIWMKEGWKRPDSTCLTSSNDKKTFVLGLSNQWCF